MSFLLASANVGAAESGPSVVVNSLRPASNGNGLPYQYWFDLCFYIKD